jgi:predicted NAD-dependent protein-ADP-ribosyltransferase YbiA (DUF1768 family)
MVALVPLAIGLFIIIAVLGWNARFTVTKGEESDDLGYFTYGYKIEQSYLRNSFTLKFWSSRGMEFVHSQGQVTVAEIVEQRWLKNDAAIFLNLRLKYHDSIVSEGPARIIFDFYRGEIYVSSGYTLWRSFDNKHDGEDWLNDAEFDAVLSRLEQFGQETRKNYPDAWFAPINDPHKPSWEILPHEAKAEEVILSKRNELGILSNFAATPFELYGKRYASVEGFWQMMLYPEGPQDERAKARNVTWKFTREQVAQMTAFEAKSAGSLAEENMKTLGIDWCTFDGKRFPYRSSTPGEHYRLIAAAMRAKAEQNPEVKRILLATGDLILKPDHHGEENPPPEWKYYDIWMQIRSDLQKAASGQ